MPIIRLRQDTVRTLPFVGHVKQQCIYWDAALENFGLRVYGSGHRVYVCSYRIHRRKRLAKLGRADVLTLDQARKKAVGYLGRVSANQDPQRESDESRQLKLVDELCDLYVEGHAKPKKITWKSDESMLRRLIKPKLKSRYASSITSADLEPIHAAFGAKHPYGANNLLKVYRKMVNWGKVAGYLPRDYETPTNGIVRFPERKRRRFVTTVEMPRLLASLEQEPNDHARHAIWLLLLTGLRSIELLKAKWVDIDWDMGTLFIGLTKNGEPLLAPLTATALARLRIVPRISGNPYIICGRSDKGHLTSLTYQLGSVLKRAGLENIRVHDLRRTVGSWLAQGGSSLHLIGEVLNHRDQSTTAGYAYFQTQQRRDALTMHGDKVLSFAAAGAALPTAPQPVQVENLLPARPEAVVLPETTELRRRHYFKREALYELVWTAPVSEVAARLGVSDVALAKLCRKAGIPIPYRGYWAKSDAGQSLKRPALPKAPERLPGLLRILGRSAPLSQTE
jgi:integrase